MTPNIAFILTLVFIILVFKIDFNRKSNVSYALWIPLIWMMNSSTRPMSFWFSTAPSTTSKERIYMEGNPFDRTILSILIIFSIYILLKRNIEWRSIFKKNVMIFLWFLFCGISILWSDFAM